jgi:hypothetical protein
LVSIDNNSQIDRLQKALQKAKDEVDYRRSVENANGGASEYKVWVYEAEGNVIRLERQLAEADEFYDTLQAHHDDNRNAADEQVYWDALVV